MTSIDTNVDNYTISELMEIIDEKTLDVQLIKTKTDKLINQFKKTLKWKMRRNLRNKPNQLWMNNMMK